MEGESADVHPNQRELMASLESRKNLIESKLQDCTQELKLLCIREAELTGVLPPEIPLEPGESPPQFRKRVGTAFQYPENLINNSKISRSKDEETLDGLELALKIQSGIVEVALGLANDPTASKAVRRKRRQDYQLAQERLQELRSQLAARRQTYKMLKQRKKPRPPVECETESVSLSQIQKVENDVDPLSQSHYYQSHMEPSENVRFIRHSASHNAFIRHPQDAKIMYPHRHQRLGYYQPHSLSPHYAVHHYPTLATCAHPELERIGYWDRHDHAPTNRNCGVSGIADQEKLWYSTAPHPVRGFSTEYVDSHNDRIQDREWFGSLDRRKVAGANRSESDFFDVRTSEKANGYYPASLGSEKQLPRALLPNQVYPEVQCIDTNGLVRAHSLDSVGCQTSGMEHSPGNRKHKEKEWYETSLDSAPQSTSYVPQPHISRTGNAASVSSECSDQTPCESSQVDTREVNRESSRSNNNSPLVSVSSVSQSSVTFDTIVPFESPKNHTVVQAGKWQPYREVTKPFEMSDFYKYSTKFRKAVGSSTQQSATSPQQKGVYQPLQPMTCQSLDPTLDATRSQSTSSSTTPQETVDGQSVGETFSTEMLAWYQDQSVPRSATLV